MLVATETGALAGERLQSESFEVLSSAGGGHGVAGASGNIEARFGFAGMIYDIVDLELSAEPPEVDELTSGSLLTMGRGDDTSLTRLYPEAGAFSTSSDAIDAFEPDGQVLTGAVYRDSLAVIELDHFGFAASTELLVRNVDPDNYGEFAGDGLPDYWQITHGIEPGADAYDDPFDSGRPLFVSAAFNLDPRQTGNHGISAIGQSEDGDYLLLRYRRSQGADLLFDIRVESAETLGGEWSTAGLAPVGEPAAIDGGAEEITVRSTTPIGERNSEFLRVQVAPR